MRSSVRGRAYTALLRGPVYREEELDFERAPTSDVAAAASRSVVYIWHPRAESTAVRQQYRRECRTSGVDE